MSSQSFIDFLNEIKFDFTNAFFIVEDGRRLTFEFDLSPFEFITFAKKDLVLGDRRGIINSITNSKRAIDCQMDRILCATGINISKETLVDDFCKHFCDSDEISNQASKLRIVNALGMAPALIISEVRTLRNKLEHEYIVPSIEDCKRALDVAELFVNATEYKMTDFWNFKMSNKYNETSGKLEGDEINCTYLHNASIEVSTSWRSSKKDLKIQILPTNITYLPLLRMFMHSDQEYNLLRSFQYMLKVCGHPIPENKVKLKNVS